MSHVEIVIISSLRRFFNYFLEVIFGLGLIWIILFIFFQVGFEKYCWVFFCFVLFLAGNLRF